MKSLQVNADLSFTLYCKISMLSFKFVNGVGYVYTVAAEDNSEPKMGNKSLLRVFVNLWEVKS